MSKNKSKSNIALLTEGASYIQRAKKERREQVESIKFDDEARREWLTGFSKRKKAKIEEKRSRAKERDHQAHLDERRKARQELKERAIENEKSVRTAMGLEDLEDASDSDDSEPEAGPSKTQTTEYDDEDGLVTVTITDDWDPSAETTKRYRSTSADSDAGEDEPEVKKRVVPLMPASSKRAKDKAKAAKKKDDITKSRSMETKAERKKGRSLELTRRMGKAGRAMERDGKQRGVKGARGRGGARGGRGGGSAGRGGRGGKK